MQSRCQQRNLGQFKAWKGEASVVGIVVMVVLGIMVVEVMVVALEFL